MKNIYVILFFAGIFHWQLSIAQNPELGKSKIKKAKKNAKTENVEVLGEMKTYYLVLLYAGPNRNQSKEEAEEIQVAHLAHIQKMAQEGKLAIAGPCLDDKELRGIFIFNVASLEEAQKLTEADPAVIAGRLRMEIHPWYSQRGAKLP